MVGRMVGPTTGPTMSEPRAGGQRSRPVRSADARPLGDHIPLGRPDPATDVPTQARPCSAGRLHSEPSELARARGSQTCMRSAQRPPQRGCAELSPGCAGRTTHGPFPVVQPATRWLSTRLRGGMVGPTMPPTTAARGLRCRVVIGGRVSWPSSWSPLAGELTAWLTRLPAHPGPSAVPHQWDRCAGLATARGPARGRSGEAFWGGRAPGRYGQRSVHSNRQRAFP